MSFLVGGGMSAAQSDGLGGLMPDRQSRCAMYWVAASAISALVHTQVAAFDCLPVNSAAGYITVGLSTTLGSY